MVYESETLSRIIIGIMYIQIAIFSYDALL